jgi:hypothetical protein
MRRLRLGLFDLSVLAIHPQWGGYNYILVANEIPIIDPATREIVEIFQT